MTRRCCLTCPNPTTRFARCGSLKEASDANSRDQTKICWIVRVWFWAGFLGPTKTHHLRTDQISHQSAHPPPCIRNVRRHRLLPQLRTRREVYVLLHLRVRTANMWVGCLVSINFVKETQDSLMFFHQSVHVLLEPRSRCRKERGPVLTHVFTLHGRTQVQHVSPVRCCARPDVHVRGCCQTRPCSSSSHIVHESCLLQVVFRRW